MKQILWLLFCFFIVTGTAFAQFPANPNKIRLGNQTTGDGLVYRTDSIPDWTPSSVNNAWVAFDTVAGVLYYYEGATWNAFTSGGSGIDSIAYASDTLYIYTPDETFKAEIVSGSSGTVTSIAAGNGITATPDPITTTGTVSLDTSVAVSKTYLAGQLILKLNISDTAAMLTPYIQGSELLPTWTTAGRPGTPSAGRTGYNTDNGNIDFYGAAAWENPVRSATATGLGTAGRMFFADANGRATGGDIAYVDLAGNFLNTTINSASGITAYNVINASSGRGTSIKIGSNTTTNFAFIGYYGSAQATYKDLIPNTAYFGGGTSSAQMAINTQGTAPIVFCTEDWDEKIRISPSGFLAIGTTNPQRTLHVTGEVRITDLTTDTPTRIVGADADGDFGALTLGTGVTIDAGVLNVAASAIADGDKGDIDVKDSGATWTIDTSAVTTLKINDGAVTEAKLAQGAAGTNKLGPLSYISADDTDVNLSSYLTIDWLSIYSQLVVWLRIGNTANRTVTFPTPSSTYQGKVVEIFFGATAGATQFGQITAGGTNRITYRDGANVAVATTYDGGQGLVYAKLICAQDPNTLAYQWLILEERSYN